MMLLAHLIYGAVLGKTRERLSQPVPVSHELRPGGPSGEADDKIPARLPERYNQYLADKDPVFITAVLPILEQSAAAQEHGVHVRYLPGGIQALTDETIPYPEVTEGVD